MAYETPDCWGARRCTLGVYRIQSRRTIVQFKKLLQASIDDCSFNSGDCLKGEGFWAPVTTTHPQKHYCAKL